MVRCTLRDSVRESSKGAIHMQWMQGVVDHDDLIIDTMPYSCWMQNKSVLKMNCNLSTPRKGTENFNL